jgi:PAS domain S-box-containing protein
MSAEWQFIVSLNEQLRPLRNPAEVQAVAIRLIGQHLAASRVSYSYVDGDEFVISRSYTDGVQPITGRGRLTQIGVGIVEAYRRGETVVVTDVRAEPRLREFEQAHWVERQTAALVGVPLIKDGRWLATFNVHSTTPRCWTPDQIALIEMTAQRAWAMGEHARAEEALSRGESRQAFLRRLSDAVRPLSEPAVILEEACRLLGTYLRANRAIYGEIDGDECVVLGGYTDGVPPLPRRFPWRQLAGSQVADILEGKTLTSNDTSTHGHTADEIPLLQAAGIGAHICPPLVKDGRFVAAFGIHSLLPRVWTREEIELVEDVADRIWATLEHRRAEAGLRANEERLAFLLRLNDAIRPLQEPGAVQETAARMLGEHLDVGRVGYAVFDGQGYVVRHQHTRGVDPLPERGPSLTFGVALHDAYSRGEMVVVSDIASDPRLTEAERASMAERQMAAFVTVRLIKGGRPVAAFGASHPTPRKWTPAEVALVRDVAERTWEATERTRVEMELLEHEAQFHRALTAAGAGCWTWDPRTGESVWDEAFRARFEFTSDETPSIETFFSRVHPDDQPRLQAQMQEILQRLDRWENTYRFVLPDGSVRWMQSLGHADRDLNGDVTRLAGFELDITERHQTDEAIQSRRDEEHNRELRLLLETASQGIVSVDADGVIVSVNHAVELMFGWEPGELPGKSIDRLVPLPFREVHQRHRAEYAVAPRPRLMGGLLGLRKDGSTFPIEVSLNHVPSAGGGRTFAFITDTTERQRAAAALQQRTDELEERTKQLSQMAWDLTLAEHHAREQIARTLHDGLQQLLVIVSLNLEVQLKRDSEAGGEPKPELQDAKRHLDEAIAAARSLSRELFPPVLHRSGLPAAIAWLANWTHEKYKLTVRVHADPRADSARSDLRSLLYESTRELLFNAVKHAKTDRVSLDLALDADDHLCVTVADEGVGFDPGSFDERWKSGQGGWGLFSIRERLTLLGGRFEVDSAVGRGTRVRLVAPRGAARGGAPGVPAVLSKPTAMLAADDKRALQDPLRILIVDDHAAVRKALRTMLHERPQLRVVGEAADGIDAIVQARRLRPDVVLMDVVMPHMDGIEATERILAEFGDIEILGMSMQARSETTHAIEHAGAAAFFVKGLDTQRLLDRLLTLHASRAGSVL